MVMALTSPLIAPLSTHFFPRILQLILLITLSVCVQPSLQRWDPSLKVVAEGYAAKCIWNHNPELEDTGENLFASTGTMDLREALEKWFLGESRICMENQNLKQLV